MNETISLDELNAEHLTTFWQVFASHGDDSVKVWDSRRLLPFVSEDHPGTEVTRLYVSTPSVEPQAIAPLIHRLSELDPQGRQRICA